MSPNSLRNLQRLGAGQRLASTIGKIGEGSQYYRMDGTAVGPILTADSFGNPVGAMHRADLLEALASGLPPEVVRTGHRCVGFEQTADIARLTFANGATAEADVVIAADGIHSVLQKYVVEPSKPIHSGSLALPRPDPPGEGTGMEEGSVAALDGADSKHFLFIRAPRRTDQLCRFRSDYNGTEESWSAIGSRDQLAASSRDGIRRRETAGAG